jgi:hypothetical protein
MEEQKGMEEEEIIQSRQASMRREDAAGDRSNNSFAGTGKRETPAAELEQRSRFLSNPRCGVRETRCSARSSFIRCKIDLSPSTNPSLVLPPSLRAGRLPCSMSE